MTACVILSPAYTSPMSLRTEISATKSQRVSTISAASTAASAITHAPCHVIHGSEAKITAYRESRPACSFNSEADCRPQAGSLARHSW